MIPITLLNIVVRLIGYMTSLIVRECKVDLFEWTIFNSKEYRVGGKLSYGGFCWGCSCYHGNSPEISKNTPARDSWAEWFLGSRHQLLSRCSSSLTEVIHILISCSIQSTKECSNLIGHMHLKEKYIIVKNITLLCPERNNAIYRDESCSVDLRQ